MQTRTKVLLLTLAVAVPAVALGAGSPAGERFWDAVWPWGVESGHEPTSAQVPFFMVIGAFEGLGLGLAVSLLAFGRPGFVARFGANGTAAWACTAWLLGNWWMHDSLHITNGEDYAGLLVIEYAFHVTLIASAAYLAYLAFRATAPGQAAAPAKAVRA